MNRWFQWFDKYKKLLLTISTIAIVAVTLYGWSAGIFTDQTKMEAFLKQCGLLAPIAFVFLQAIQVVIPILPGAVGCLYGVILFGAFYGFVLNYIGICIGSIWAFLIARHFGQEFVRKMTGKKFMDKYSKYLARQNRFEKLFALLIFLPVAPDDFLCYPAGVSEMKFKNFTVIILLGKPAAILMYSMGLNSIFQQIVKFAA